MLAFLGTIQYSMRQTKRQCAIEKEEQPLTYTIHENEGTCMSTHELLTRFCKAFWMSFSVDVSSALVASSSNKIGGFFNNVQVIATCCFLPLLSQIPLLPTLVSYPSGKVIILSCICAACAANSTSEGVAPNLPYLHTVPNEVVYTEEENNLPNVISHTRVEQNTVLWHNSNVLAQ